MLGRHCSVGNGFHETSGSGVEPLKRPGTWKNQAGNRARRVWGDADYHPGSVALQGARSMSAVMIGHGLLLLIRFFPYSQLVLPFRPAGRSAASAGRLKVLTQGMSGSILLASEGINGMVAGTASQLQAFEACLAKRVLTASLAGTGLQAQRMPDRAVQAHARQAQARNCGARA